MVGEQETRNCMVGTDARRGRQQAAMEGRTRIKIHTPLIRLSKADIVKLGRELGVDFGLTHSCYDPDSQGRPCGACDSCLLRKKGFAEAGIKDPLGL